MYEEVISSVNKHTDIYTFCFAAWIPIYNSLIDIIGEKYQHNLLDESSEHLKWLGYSIN